MMVQRNVLTTLFLAVTLVISAQAGATTPEEDEQDIVQHLPELKPITYRAAQEKYHLVIFVENQCVYCSDVLKNVKAYTDAGLTMSFLTYAPKSIRDSVIEDMSRVWCAADPGKSLQNSMKGFLPENDSTPECTHLIEQQSALADRLGIQATPSMIVMKPTPVVFLGNVKPDVILNELSK